METSTTTAITFRHERYCGCPGCNEAAQKHVRECLSNGGWCAYVANNDDYPNGIVAHTYGLKEKFDHLDFQICFPLQEREVIKTFTLLAKAIEAGESFRAGKEYYGMFDVDVHMRFINVTDKGRDLLRILIPTNNDDFEYPAHKAQFTKTK